MADNIAASADGQATSQATYSDVVAKDWYATEFANAAAVGYLSGYPDGTMKPQNPVTRQEVAAVLARILPAAVVSDDNNDDGSFNDQAQIPEWSQAAIAAAVNSGYMNGYPDGTFQPGKAITRAEAVAVLERAVGTLYNGAGTYGPIQGVTTLEGNVTITTPGVTLQNTIITGNLYLTEGIGEGDVTLNNVTVKGALIANAPVRVQGQGTIETARVNVDGVVIEAPVKNVFLADGVQATVNGKNIIEDYQYTESQKKKSKDVTLSDLTINGTTISGFAVDTMSYEVALPFGTTAAEIPTVAATAHHAKARVEVTQATDLTAPDNVATVRVTAENGRTQTYTVTFTVALSPETALTVFEIGGYDVLSLPGVTGETGATLRVPNFSSMQGITVQTADPDVQSVTVTLNDAVVAEGELATEVIQPNDVIVVTIVAADAESTAQYKVTVEYGPIDDFSCSEDDGTGATFTWTEADGAEALESNNLQIMGKRGKTPTPPL